MFESNLLGTHPAFLATALKKHTIVHEITITLPVEAEDKIWDTVVELYDGKPYDFGGVLYIGWRKILYRLLRIPIPEKNKWARPGAYFCDEVYLALNCIDAFPVTNIVSGMETPHDLWLRLRQIGE